MVDKAPHTPMRIWSLPSSCGSRGSIFAFCSVGGGESVVDVSASLSIED